MNRLTAILSALVFATSAYGQTIIMKDGKKVVAKALRRAGDNIMATSPAVDGAAALQGEIGYPLSQIEKLEFPEPAVIKTGADLVANGRAADALNQIESALTYFAGFRDAPGSYWADLALLKLSAFAALNRDADAEPLARQIVSQASNPDTVRGAKAYLAGVMGRKGDHAGAIEMCDQILKEGSKPETMAAAAISKARSHQALKQWDAALLAYLNIPVFYPEQKSWISTYLLGSAQCYFELSDLPRAKEALNELIKLYPNGAEAAQAKTELDKITRREKALETVQ